MKRFAIIVVMTMLGFAAWARPIHYFTLAQAERTVRMLNGQNELMIWCGYDYEVETYVLVSEVWKERVNSAYYEVWVYGWDAYTGDEVYMPLDLQCVWVFDGVRVRNAAEVLRFRTEVCRPSFAWHVPAYWTFNRVSHSRSYSRSYHWDVHRHGWMPTTYRGHSLPPYYMRRRTDPAPMPTTRWTPGVDRPQVSTATPARTVPSGAPQGTSTARPATTTNTRNTATPAGNTAKPASTTTRSVATPQGTTGSNGAAPSTTPSRNSSKPSATSRGVATPSTSSSSTGSSSTSSSSSSSTTRGTATPSRNTASPSASSSSNSRSTASPTREVKREVKRDVKKVESQKVESKKVENVERKVETRKIAR